MRKTKKIIVLITYFGDFPWYFSYFLHSCQFNSTIDFLIFSDSVSKYPLPANVKMIGISLEEIKKLARKKLAMKVSIDFPYKLCDFKPAYGLIFEDYTKGYEYWAQSDIDLIYGNLRSLITNKMLAGNDFISMRHDYATGCFTISRNSFLMNIFFKKSKDYKKVFTSKRHFAFDEVNFKHCEINEGKKLDEIETEIESFTHIIKRAQQRNEIKAHFDFMLIEGVPGKIKFDKGKLTYGNIYEVALYHLFWFKQIYHSPKTEKAIADTYRISPTRIYRERTQS